MAHGLIVFAQRKVPIGIMSMMQVGQPALAVVWSAIFLSQSIRALQMLGMVLVVFGLATVVVQTQRRTARLHGDRKRGARRIGGLRGWAPPPTET